MKLFHKLVRNQASGQLLKVYSHPRSGTHFLEAFIARNFYPDKDLTIAPVAWGHWSNRKEKADGNPYGLLFGSHYFPELAREKGPKIYIYRDGRAVAYSIWKTPNFLHKEISQISFSDFLRMKLDWEGSPSRKSNREQTILQHWKDHVASWKKFAKKNNFLVISYEALIDEPYEQYLKIHSKYFRGTKVKSFNELELVLNPVGLLPNKAKPDSWKEEFSEEDNRYYQSIITAL